MHPHPAINIRGTKPAGNIIILRPVEEARYQAAPINIFVNQTTNESDRIKGTDFPKTNIPSLIFYGIVCTEKNFPKKYTKLLSFNVKLVKMSYKQFISNNLFLQQTTLIS